MKKHNLIIPVLFMTVWILFGGVVSAEELPVIPAKDMVTLVDLGASSCIPCKMMEPILEKAKKRYDGKAAIIVIDLRYHREQAQRFQVRAIPTQVFFDREGKEVYRHMGFMSEEAIAEQLKKMGVEG